MKSLLICAAFLCLLIFIPGFPAIAAETEVRLVKDIADIDANADPYAFTVSNGLLFFSATDGAHGNELWRSDGTAAGTFMVRDIFPGEEGSSPLSLVNFNDRLYFFASDGVTGREFWTSDGTEEGTVLVKDMSPNQSDSSLFRPPVIANGMMFFNPYTRDFGDELWVSDGTTDGTKLVKDIVPGPDGARIFDLVSIGRQVLFSAIDGATGSEIWRSDGTEQGTVLVKDAVPGENGSNPSYMFAWEGAAYYQATDGTNGYEIWKSDGTEQGTFMLADLNPGSDSSSARNFMAANGALYFQATGPGIGVELFKTDGTAQGTGLVKDINPGSGSSVPADFIRYGNSVFFRANELATGTEMWMTDGTEAGTQRVLDLHPEGSGTFADPVILDGLLYFAAQNAESGLELFRSDGTPEGTALVKDVYPGPSHGYQNQLIVFDGALYFGGNDGANGSTLWRSDGTEEGTALVKNINPASTSSHPRNLTVAADSLFFIASDGITGDELWKSDGTEDGTELVKEINPRSSSLIAQMTAFADMLLFVARDPDFEREPFTSDGTAGGTHVIKDIYPGNEGSFPTQYTIIGDTVFFIAEDDVDGTALWKSDGTEQGTIKVRDVYPGNDQDGIDNLAAAGNTLFFLGNDGNSGAELWKSNGNTAGTVRVKNIAPGANSSLPDNLTGVGNTLFFTAYSPSYESGAEPSLWKSDGTNGGTVQVAVLNAQSDPKFEQFLAVGDLLYFVADDGEHGRELWRSDGTTEGTYLVKDIWPGIGRSSIRNIINVDGRLYFYAVSPNGGGELWTSDGTENGTRLLADIYPDGNSNIEDLLEINGTLFFSAEDGTHGRELWQSHGSMDGTFMVADIYPGEKGSDASELAQRGNNLFFSADEGQNGVELWAAEIPFGVSYIRRMDEDPSVADIVHFEARFNRPVTGVDASDFTIDAEPAKVVTGASIMSVTGQGDFYTVTVDAGRGDGRLSIDLIDDDSIVADDGSEEPLGGAGANNGDFLFGEAYELDGEPPVVTIDPISTNRSTPLITGTIDDLLATIIVTINGEADEAILNGDGTWFTNWDNRTPIEEDGIYEVEAVATDLAGNVGMDQTTGELRIDTVPPTVTVDRLITSMTSPELTGTVSEADATIRIRYNSRNGDAVNNGDGTWTLPEGTIISTGDGIYDVMATATDAAGNEAVDETTMELTLDTTAPNILLLGEAVVQLRAGDTFTDPGVSIGEAIDSNPEVETGGDTVNEDVPSIYTITYTAVDDAGNRSETVMRVVVVLAAEGGAGVGASAEPCVLSGDITLQTQTFLTNFGGGAPDNDLDGDGLPEDFAVALALEATCMGDDQNLAISTINAYVLNRLASLDEADKAEFANIAEALPMLLLLSTSPQQAVVDALANGDIDLTKDYEVVACDGSGFCTPSGAKDGFYEVLGKQAAFEPYAGGADLDGDGITNAQEAANVLARGGTAHEFALAAMDETDDGSVDPTPPPPPGCFGGKDAPGGVSLGNLLVVGLLLATLRLWPNK